MKFSISAITFSALFGWFLIDVARTRMKADAYHEIGLYQNPEAQAFVNKCAGKHFMNTCWAKAFDKYGAKE